AVVLDLLSDMEVWRRTTDGRQLVAEIAVQDLEPFWKLDCCFTVGIQDRISSVEVQHFRRFQGSVIEVLVGGVEGMINSEALRSRTLQVPGDLHVARECPR